MASINDAVFIFCFSSTWV